LGFTEIYNYSLVSEDLFDGPVDRAIKLKNPLSEDMMYLRNSLVPSLLTSVDENKGHDEIKIFEMSGVYEKRQGDLPKEILKDPWASAGFNPIASKIWLGSNFMEEQAEPVETAMLCKSSWITKDSPSTKENLAFTLLGSLFFASPFK